MTKPQQPEVARSGKGEVTQGGRRFAREADKELPEGGKTGKAPQANEPGRRKPEDEQDTPPPAR